jgi:S-formylglutathione hydrolase FrmB
MIKVISISMALALCVTTIFLAGCGQRENTVEPEQAVVGFLWNQALNRPSLVGNSLRDVPSRTIYIYAPDEDLMRGESEPYPVLYLLHDYGADHHQFEIYNLLEIIADLSAAGEIEPMLVVIIEATNLYGLGMYANSSVCGNYEDLIVPELVDQIDKEFAVHTEGGREARAIGGIGFGGQAAVKLAIKHPELFSSVSAMNAPLAFAGDGGVTTEGIPGLFKYFFIENDLPAGDFEAYKSVRDDPDPSKFITNMIFSMAAAFSPTVDLNYLRPWSVRDTIPNYTDVVYFELPFDHQAYLESQVWDRWLEHDVRTLYAQNEYQDALDDIAVYIDAGADDQYGFQHQSALFAQDLAAHGKVDYQFEIYSGTDGLTADHNQMLALRLIEVLKFHSAHLEQPEGQ